jgi:hypothetical protein
MTGMPMTDGTFTAPATTRDADDRRDVHRAMLTFVPLGDACEGMPMTDGTFTAPATTQERKRAGIIQPAPANSRGDDVRGSRR